MLALHENALLAALKGHRSATKVRTVASLLRRPCTLCLVESR